MEMFYNNTPSLATEKTPFEIVYGKTFHVPGTISSTRNDAGEAEDDLLTPPVESHLKKLGIVQETVRYNLEHARQRQKEYADRSRRHLSFVEGDAVLLSTCNLSLKGVVS